MWLMINTRQLPLFKIKEQLGEEKKRAKQSRVGDELFNKIITRKLSSWLLKFRVCYHLDIVQLYSALVLSSPSLLGSCSTYFHSIIYTMEICSLSIIQPCLDLLQ